MSYCKNCGEILVDGTCKRCGQTSSPSSDSQQETISPSPNVVVEPPPSGTPDEERGGEDTGRDASKSDPIPRAAWKPTPPRAGRPISDASTFPTPPGPGFTSTRRMGFQVDEDVVQVFRASEAANTRWLKIVATDGRLSLVDRARSTGILRDDLDAVGMILEDTTPCFILFRLDTRNPIPRRSSITNSLWLFITWVPDATHVREKMLYAASAETLKNELGSRYFEREMQCSHKSEVTFASYKASQDTPRPWSRRDLAVRELDRAEEEARREQEGHAHSGIHSVPVALATGAAEAIEQMRRGEVNWIELGVTEKRDGVDVAIAKMVSEATLNTQLHNEEPRFYIYSFQRSNPTTVVVIYHVPTQSPVQLRMVYATSKTGVVNACKKGGLRVEKSIEVVERDELTHSMVMEEVRGGKGMGVTNRMEYRKPIPSSSTAHAMPEYTRWAGTLPGTEGSTSSSGKKKIVIPPRDAYC